MYDAKRGTSFLRRNGLKQTFFSYLEKKQKAKNAKYIYKVPDICERAAQARRKFLHPVLFSILVPAYETKESYFKEMVNSCIKQSYQNWELIIADASKSDVVENMVELQQDKRINYIRVKTNGGISDNTNIALKKATGDYVCLLDHDDLLTPDALYEMALKLEENPYQFVYSDEDKCDESGKRYFEPHFKKEFNFDLFLSNNYICHFVAIKRELLEDNAFRSEFDGAQDFDCFLRVLEKIKKDKKKGWQDAVGHISKVLYHWRCHSGSTAANPSSKMYAYEAGRKAVEDYFRRNDIKVEVKHGRHLGFYRIKYLPSLFEARKDIGAVGNFIYRKNKVVSGPIDEKTGQCIYLGLRRHFSGYMNQGNCMQEVDALDIRNMKVRNECKYLLEEVIKEFPKAKQSKIYSDPILTRNVSIAYSKKIREKGYQILFDPYFKK
jgi:glycosyltransferase involved in cell wall biosynthesis